MRWTWSVARISITIVATALALGALGLLYYRFVHFPWTRDAQIRANVVGIAPRVSGPIICIPLNDNQRLRKGDLLFEIDPSTYQASFLKAKGILEQAQSNLVRAKQQLDRNTILYNKKVIDLRDLQDAQDEYASAAATLRTAQATLQATHLDLGFTRVVSPIDGYLTNFDTSPGTYVTAGQRLLALVDSNSFWVAAYFTETQLAHIHVGDSVRIKLMSHPKMTFYGKVESVGWGIHRTDGAAVNLLPQVQQTIEWVRLPQRFPVRIKFDPHPPVPLRIGETATVSIIRRPY
ncbi:MAG: efflux transporter periplasmic adaptor subunit [Verrucomicrobia bacterium]|nr:MAG: efflux transporter periplasmic adaptor subunit [Verrucomicrobiota bacterium]